MKTHRSQRLHIGLFGRRNVGKSSLLNAITHQDSAIVSSLAGTTSDPVEKAMELLPFGPVLFIDTAGIDDDSSLSDQRIAKTRQVFERTDIALIVSDTQTWGDFEQLLLQEFVKRSIPVLVVMNKSDLRPINMEICSELEVQGISLVETSALLKKGIMNLKERLLALVPADYIQEPDLLGDIVGEGEMAVLVVPIDKEAPKGRLILPQVRAIRNLLDNHAWCLVVKEGDLRLALDNLRHKPKLVVTDSQAFQKVAQDTPDDVLMTSFSILFARLQGDLSLLVAGALAINQLKEGDLILITESCSHHPIEEDIGRVKLPQWLSKHSGVPLQFSHTRGHDFPEDLSSYKMVIQCGGCMTNRKEILSRIMHCQNQGVPMTNYGLAIALSLGILERALKPFPEIYQQLSIISGHKARK